MNGAITYCASWVTGETILGESAGEVNQAIFDVGFSSGVTYTAAAIEAGITNTSREEKPSISISQASEPTPNRESQTQSSGAGGSIVRYAYLY